MKGAKTNRNENQEEEGEEDGAEKKSNYFIIHINPNVGVTADVLSLAKKRKSKKIYIKDVKIE